MPIEPKVMYFAKCNKCGTVFANEGGGTFFISEERVIRSLEDCGWQYRAKSTQNSEKCYCVNCKEK